MSSTEVTVCSPKKFLEGFSKKFYDLDEIVRCFLQTSEDREENFRRTLQETKIFSSVDIKALEKHEFKTIPDAFNIIGIVDRLNSQYAEDIHSLPTQLLDALFIFRKNKMPLKPLEGGDNSCLDCIPYIQRKSLETHLRHMRSNGIIGEATFDTLMGFLPNVHSYADVREMANLACPEEAPMTKDLSKGRFEYDIKWIFLVGRSLTGCRRIFGVGSSPSSYSNYVRIFETPMIKRIRYALLKRLMSSYADENIVTPVFASFSSQFTTRADINGITEKICTQHEWLKTEMTPNEATDMFWYDLMKVSKLDGIYQECYERHCPGCPRIASICPDYALLETQFKEYVTQNGAPNSVENMRAHFYECIGVSVSKRKADTKAALARKIKVYKEYDYIKSDANDNDILQTELNSCEEARRWVFFFKSHRKIALKPPPEEMKTNVAGSCYHRFLDEYSVAYFNENIRCYMQVSAERQMNLVKLFEEFRKKRLFNDWVEFGFTKNSPFNTVADAYRMAKAAYLARNRGQFSLYTYEKFLMDFLDAMFRTKGEIDPVPQEEIAAHECRVLSIQGNLDLLMIRYEEYRVIPNRYIFNAVRNFSPTVRTFADVRQMASITCSGYNQAKRLPVLLIEDIRIDIALASYLKTRMRFCHQKRCKIPEIRMLWSHDGWKNAIIECYKKMHGSISTVFKGVLEREFDSCVKKGERESNVENKSRIGNLYQLMTSYKHNGVITEKMFDEIREQPDPFPRSFAGVRKLAFKIYNFQLKKQWEQFSEDLMMISKLPWLYGECYGTVCNPVAGQVVITCWFAADCLRELKQRTSEGYCQKRYMTAEIMKWEFDTCVSNAFNKPERSTTEIQANLQEKLTHYKKLQLIEDSASNLPRTPLITEEDVVQLVDALYKSFLNLYGVRHRTRP